MKTNKLLQLIQQKNSKRSGGALPLHKKQNGGNTDLQSLAEQYELTNKAIQAKLAEKKVYADKVRAAAQEAIDKRIAVEKTGFVPQDILCNPSNNYCISAVSYMLSQAGDDSYKYFSNSKSYNDALAGKNPRVYEPDEKYIEPTDVLEFRNYSKRGPEAGEPYHAALVLDVVDYPDMEGWKEVKVAMNHGKGAIIPNSYFLSPDNKLHHSAGDKSPVPTLLMKKNWNRSELNNLINTRNNYQQQILGIDPLYFTPQKDIRSNDYHQTAFLLNQGVQVEDQGTDRYGNPLVPMLTIPGVHENEWNTTYGGNPTIETIRTDESFLPDIINQYTDPKYKYNFMRSHNITSNEYDALVKNMIGIYGQESKFGTDYVGKTKKVMGIKVPAPEWPWATKMADKLGFINQEEKSIGPFQVTYNQLPEAYRKSINVRDLYNPVKGAEAVMEYLAAGLPLLRKRAGTTAETATENNPYSSNITKDNYLEYLPYLYNMRSWLKGDEATMEEKGDILKGEAAYKKAVDAYANNVLQVIPMPGLTTPMEVVIEEKKKKKQGGSLPKAQKGVQPFITSDINEYNRRKQAYADSLYTYNYGQANWQNAQLKLKQNVDKFNAQLPSTFGHIIGPSIQLNTPEITKGSYWSKAPIRGIWPTKRAHQDTVDANTVSLVRSSYLNSYHNPSYYQPLTGDALQLYNQGNHQFYFPYRVADKYLVGADLWDAPKQQVIFDKNAPQPPQPKPPHGIEIIEPIKTNKKAVILPTEEYDMQPIREEAPQGSSQPMLRMVPNPNFNLGVGKRTKEAVVDALGNPRNVYYYGDKAISKKEYSKLWDAQNNKFTQGGSLSKAQNGGTASERKAVEDARTWMMNWTNSPIHRKLLEASVDKDDPLGLNSWYVDQAINSRKNFIQGVNISPISAYEMENMNGGNGPTNKDGKSRAAAFSSSNPDVRLPEGFLGIPSFYSSDPAMYSDILKMKPGKDTVIKWKEGAFNLPYAPEESIPTFTNVIGHEVSHASDMGGRGIPKSDVDYMKGLFDLSTKIKPGTQPTPWQNYVGEATETRARLNQLRMQMQREGVYDPFNQFAPKDALEKYKGLKRYDPLRQLRDVYDDYQIINMLNTISRNESSEVSNKAQKGGIIAQNGKTIYVTDPNDPRLKAYQDSLYVRTLFDQKFTPGNKTRPLTEAEKKEWKNEETGLVPNIVEYTPDKKWEYFGHFKKPVLKVELKREEIEPITRKFDFSVDEDIQPIAPTPYVPNPVRRVMNPAFDFNVDFEPNRTKEAAVDKAGNPRYKYYNGDKVITEQEYKKLMQKKQGGSLPKAQVGLPSDYAQFLEYSKTAPENRRPDANWKYGDPRNYDHYGMWDALGKPKNWEEALRNNPEWERDEYDRSYHGFSTNPNTGVWLKSHIPGEYEPGNTSWMENLAFQLSGDPNYNPHNFSLVFDPELQRMRYIPKEKKGGKISKRQNGGLYDRALEQYNTLKSGPAEAWNGDPANLTPEGNLNLCLDCINIDWENEQDVRDANRLIEEGYSMGTHESHDAYMNALKKFNLSEPMYNSKKISQSTLPENKRGGSTNYDGLYVAQSKIKGADQGLFAKRNYKKGEEIGLAHVNGQPYGMVGHMHNHSENPNMHSVKNGNTRTVYAKRDIKAGEELTTNYRMQPELEQPEDFKKQKGGSLSRAQLGGSPLQQQLIAQAMGQNRVVPSTTIVAPRNLQQQTTIKDIQKYGSIQKAEQAKQAKAIEQSIADQKQSVIYAPKPGSANYEYYNPEQYVYRDDKTLAPQGSLRGNIQNNLNAYNQFVSNQTSILQNTSLGPMRGMAGLTGLASDMLINGPIQSALNLANTFMGDRPIRGDEDFIGIFGDAFNALPVFSSIRKGAKTFNRASRLASEATFSPTMGIMPGVMGEGLESGSRFLKKTPVTIPGGLRKGADDVIYGNLSEENILRLGEAELPITQVMKGQRAIPDGLQGVKDVKKILDSDPALKREMAILVKELNTKHGLTIDLKNINSLDELQEVKKSAEEFLMSSDPRAVNGRDLVSKKLADPSTQVRKDIRIKNSDLQKMADKKRELIEEMKKYSYLNPSHRPIIDEMKKTVDWIDNRIAIFESTNGGTTVIDFPSGLKYRSQVIKNPNINGGDDFKVSTRFSSTDPRVGTVLTINGDEPNLLNHWYFDSSGGNMTYYRQEVKRLKAIPNPTQQDLLELKKFEDAITENQKIAGEMFTTSTQNFPKGTVISEASMSSDSYPMMMRLGRATSGKKTPYKLLTPGEAALQHTTSGQRYAGILDHRTEMSFMDAMKNGDMSSAPLVLPYKSPNSMGYTEAVGRRAAHPNAIAFDMFNKGKLPNNAQEAAIAINAQNNLFETANKTFEYQLSSGKISQDFHDANIVKWFEDPLDINNSNLTTTAPIVTEAELSHMDPVIRKRFAPIHAPDDSFMWDPVFKDGSGGFVWDQLDSNSPFRYLNLHPSDYQSFNLNANGIHFKQAIPTFLKEWKKGGPIKLQSGGFTYENRMPRETTSTIFTPATGYNFPKVYPVDDPILDLVVGAIPYFGAGMDYAKALNASIQGNYADAIINTAGAILPFVAGSTLEGLYDKTKEKLTDYVNTPNSSTVKKNSPKPKVNPITTDREIDKFDEKNFRKKILSGFSMGGQTPKKASQMTDAQRRYFQLLINQKNKK